jgi:hypothetical protein
MDRGGMAKIVKSWLLSGAAVAPEDASPTAQTLESDFTSLPFHCASMSGAEKWRIMPCMLSPTFSDVAIQNPNQVGADRHEAGLIELCIADVDDTGTKIDVRHRESQCLTDPKGSSI